MVLAVTILKYMNANLILGATLFMLGVIQLLPTIRHRAAQRGMSGRKAIPFVICFIGFITFLIGCLQFKIT